MGVAGTFGLGGGHRAGTWRARAHGPRGIVPRVVHGERRLALPPWLIGAPGSSLAWQGCASHPPAEHAATRMRCEQSLQRWVYVMPYVVISLMRQSHAHPGMIWLCRCHSSSPWPVGRRRTPCMLLAYTPLPAACRGVLAGDCRGSSLVACNVSGHLGLRQACVILWQAWDVQHLQRPLHLPRCCQCAWAPSAPWCHPPSTRPPQQAATAG